MHSPSNGRRVGYAALAVALLGVTSCGRGSGLNEGTIRSQLNEHINKISCAGISLPLILNKSDNRGKFYSGYDTLPERFDFGSNTYGQYDLSGLEPYIESGLLSAKEVKTYATILEGDTYTHHVYEVDINPKMRSSSSFKVLPPKTDGQRPNDTAFIPAGPTSDPFIEYCPGQRKVDSVSFSVPGDSGISQVEFSWSTEVKDEVAQSFVRSEFWKSNGEGLAVDLAGSSTATFRLMNDGWRLQVDE